MTPNAFRQSLLACVLLAGASIVACSGGPDADAANPDGTVPPGSGTTPGSNPGDRDGATTTGDAAPDGAPGPSSDGGADATDGSSGGFAYKPVPSGCVTDVAAGDHAFTCETLKVDATIPDMFAKCPVTGCGLILELHGDTGTGPTLDAHMTLRARGAQRGYIVLAPTGPAIGTIGPTAYPGSTWGASQDVKLLAMVQTFIAVFKPDPKRIHVTGFSRGGFTTWRFACDQSNLFASVAVGGAGNGAGQLTVNAPEATCFEGARVPARPLDILMLMGRTDALYPKMVSVRDNALANYTLAPSDRTVVKQSGTAYTQTRAKKVGKPVVEWFDHAYEIDPAVAPLYATAKGHCVPGSTVPANALYPMACKPPTAIDWGAEILSFFDAHPKP